MNIAWGLWIRRAVEPFDTAVLRRATLGDIEQPFLLRGMMIAHLERTSMQHRDEQHQLQRGIVGSGRRGTMNSRTTRMKLSSSWLRPCSSVRSRSPPAILIV